MPIITWVVLGLIAGFSASKLINATGESLLMNLVLGVAGAMTGGELFNKFWMAWGVKGAEPRERARVNRQRSTFPSR